MALSPTTSRGSTSSGGVTVLDYTAFTANVTVSAVDEPSADTVVSAGAVTFDGSTLVRIEFFCEAVVITSSAGGYIQFVLYDGAASIGLFGIVQTPSMAAPVLLSRLLTPSATAHTYSVRAFRNAGNGSCFAGAGGSGAKVPGYIRITSGS